MDIIKTYKSNKNMTETERIEHLKQLNRVRRNRAYRKKKMDQLKMIQNIILIRHLKIFLNFGIRKDYEH